MGQAHHKKRAHNRPQAVVLRKYGVADPGQHAASGWIIGISGIKIEFRVAGSDALRAYPSVQRMTPSSLPRRQYLLESGNICLIRLIRSFDNRECFRLSRRAEIREYCRVCADARPDD